MNVETHSSSEPPLAYNQDQMPLRNQGHLSLSWPTYEWQEYYAVSEQF